MPWLITKYPVVGDVTKLDILYMNMCHGPSQNIKPWLITKYPAVGDVAKLDRLYMYMLPWLITKYPVVGHVAKLDIQDGGMFATYLLLKVPDVLCTWSELK